MYPPIITKVYSTSRYTDESGEEWLVINQDTHYSLSHWSEVEAIADYQKPEVAAKRAQDEWSLWTD